MNRQPLPLRAAGMLSALLLSLTATGASAQAPKLDAFVTTGLSDLRASVKTVKADTAELEKINRDFATLYRLRKLTVSIKEPGRFRFENEVGLYLVNGATRYYQVAALKLKKREDLGPALSKRPSLLDLGLLTPAVLAMVEGRYVRTDVTDGVGLPVFDVTFREEDSVRYRMWIDPKTRVIVRREWRDASGKLRAVFLCQEPREVKPGIWLPTRIEVRNADGAVAGVLSYSDVAVNSGLDDALFAIP